MRIYLSEEKQKSKRTDDRPGKNTGSKGLARTLHTVFTAQPMKKKKSIGTVSYRTFKTT